MRVLIADDDELVAGGIADILTALGHQASIAANPDAALAELSASVWDLILVDLHMPGGGGEQLLSLLGRDGVPAVRAVIVTGDSGWPGPGTGHAVQAPVLHKPFSLAALKAVLESTPAGPGNGGDRR